MSCRVHSTSPAEQQHRGQGQSPGLLGPPALPGDGKEAKPPGTESQVPGQCGWVAFQGLAGTPGERVWNRTFINELVSRVEQPHRRGETEMFSDRPVLQPSGTPLRSHPWAPWSDRVLVTSVTLLGPDGAAPFLHGHAGAAAPGFET